jgi:hypothetical protein
MFKKIWNYLFGPKWYPNPAPKSFPGTETVDHTEANASVNHSNHSIKIMNGPYIQYTVLPPKNDHLHRASASSSRVYLYNISPMTYEKEHPIFKFVVIPKCSIGKPYKLAFSLPEVMVLTDYKIDVYETDYIYQDGKRVAMDIVNPDNFGLDQNVRTSYRYLHSIGNDLGVRGVFWSMHNPPTEEELESVKQRYRKHCKSLLELAAAKTLLFGETVQRYVDKRYTREEAYKAAIMELNITPEHHAAADYLRIKTQWHPVLEKKD